MKNNRIIYDRSQPSIAKIDRETGTITVNTDKFIDLDKKVKDLIIINMKLLKKYNGDNFKADAKTFKKIKKKYPKISYSFFITAFVKSLLPEKLNNKNLNRIKALI